MSNHNRSSRPDSELVEVTTARRGTPEGAAAPSELLGRYRQRVYQWCFRYTREHEAALDLAQDVLLRAYQKLDSFEGRSQFSSWLFAVTRSTCLNAIKKVDFMRDAEFDVESLSDAAARPDEIADTVLDRERMLEVIRGALDAQEQEAIVLRYFEQLSPDEITRIMKLDGKSGARGLLQRARRKLVKAVGGREGD